MIKGKRQRQLLIWCVACLLVAGCAPRGIVRVELEELEERGTRPLMIRVNILEGMGHVTVSGKKEYRVRMGKKGATSPAGKEWTLKLVNGEKIIETKSSRKRKIQDPQFPVIFSQKIENGYITVNGLPYRGHIIVKRVGRDRLMVVNQLPMEDYLRSVVPSEIGNGSSLTLEAVKAQAVAARTYAVSNLNKHERLGYDLVATTGDQVYSGVIRESDLSDRAVSETRGVIAMYRDEPINAVYHSTCGGHTCDNEDYWLGKAVPYLRGRPDFVSSLFGRDEAFCKDSPMYRWTRRWNRREFAEMVETNLRSILGTWPKGKLISVKVLKKDKYDRATVVEVKTTKTCYKVEKGRIRTLFKDPKKGWVGLPSTAFEIVFDGTSYVMHGRGWGHGVGMCQWGAIGMAKKGYSYRDILEHYYGGAYLAKIY
jgi:stage II sporulation protein D